MCIYTSINGNISVPLDYGTKEGVRLGKWIKIQHICQNLLSTIQISILYYILSDWDPLTNDWESKFDLYH